MTFDLPLHPEECVKAPTCEISSVLRVHIAHACESGVPDAHLMQIPSAADIGDTAAGQVSKSKSLLCIQEADQAPPPCCEIDLDTIASRCESISKPKAIGVAELQCVEAASLQLTAGNSSSFPAHPVSNAGSRKQDPLDDQHSISIHALPSKALTTFESDQRADSYRHLMSSVNRHSAQLHSVPVLPTNFRDNFDLFGNQIDGEIRADNHQTIMVMCVEQVLHLETLDPIIGAQDAQNETMWVSYLWKETGELVRTSAIPCKGSGKWYHSRYLPLSLFQLRASSAQTVLLEVHRRVPGKIEQTVGSVHLDLAPLFSGLSELRGWYHIIGSDMQPKGQLKLCVASADSVTLASSIPPLVPHSCARSIDGHGDHEHSTRSVLSLDHADDPARTPHPAPWLMENGISQALGYPQNFGDLLDNTETATLKELLRTNMNDLEAMSVSMKSRLELSTNLDLSTMETRNKRLDKGTNQVADPTNACDAVDELHRKEDQREQDRRRLHPCSQNIETPRVADDSCIPKLLVEVDQFPSPSTEIEHGVCAIDSPLAPHFSEILMSGASVFEEVVQAQANIDPPGCTSTNRHTMVTTTERSSTHAKQSGRHVLNRLDSETCRVSDIMSKSSRR